MSRDISVSSLSEKIAYYERNRKMIMSDEWSGLSFVFAENGLFHEVNLH